MRVEKKSTGLAASICFLMIVLTLTLQPLTCLAQISSAEMAMKCTDQHSEQAEASLNKLFCLGYISGLNDVVPILAMMNPTEFRVCLPKNGITNERALTIFLDWLRRMPSDLTMPARTSFLTAIKEAYKCK